MCTGSPGRRHGTAFLLRAGLLACLALCTTGAPRRSLLAGDWLNDLPGARTMTINDTPLSSFRNVVNVRISVRSFLDVGEQRPLKFFFLNAVINRSPEVESYILDTVMPAANSIIARSIRVRRPPPPWLSFGQANPEGSILDELPELPQRRVSVGWGRLSWHRICRDMGDGIPVWYPPRGRRPRAIARQQC